MTAQGQPSIGRQISVWLRADLVDKLDRLAKERGVKRNRVVNQIIDEVDED